MNREKISAELKELAEELGFEYVGAEFVREAGTPVLRVYIDREGGVSLDDCEKVSQAAGTMLDARADDFDGNYLLEVSSPGIERPLFSPTDYERFTGRPVSVKLKKPVEGRRRVSAVIEGREGENILLNCGGEPIAVPFEQIGSAHLVYVEEKGQKKTFRKRGGKN